MSIRGRPVVSLRVDNETKQYLCTKGRYASDWCRNVLFKAICFEIETGHNFLTGENDLEEQVRIDFALYPKKFTIRRSKRG